MSKISNLIGKSKTFKIGDLELEIKPRTLKDLDLFMEFSNEGQRGEAMKKLIKMTLKDAVPDVTEEELDQVGMKYFNVISQAILEVNGLLVKENVIPS
ncbi:MAG TPA: hypothetical protein VMX17_03210 [Candidatus Glassbacteria bacterium]|nr:hypothetical protein [Candidatus Glassbacteria bacterium]